VVPHPFATAVEAERLIIDPRLVILTAGPSIRGIASKPKSLGFRAHHTITSPAPASGEIKNDIKIVVARPCIDKQRGSK
jgi:hypothetical protein